MTSYVVGLDATERAHSVLDWALTTATPGDRVVAVHAWEVPVVTGYEAVAAVDVESIQASAEALVATTLAERGDDRLTAHAAAGHPGRALVDAAAEVTDATIVVGHGGSSKAALLLGSTANYVIHHTERPVVVVRGECRLPVRTVVVGVDQPGDGAPDVPSVDALRWAFELPGVERIEVHHADFVPGVAAGPLSQAGVESEDEISEDERDLRAAIAVATGGDSVPANGAEVVAVVASGTGAFDLIEASRAVDLVVVGSRGRSGLIQLVTGSTTLEVVAHAHCPVAVVR